MSGLSGLDRPVTGNTPFGQFVDFGFDLAQLFEDLLAEALVELDDLELAFRDGVAGPRDAGGELAAQAFRACLRRARGHDHEAHSKPRCLAPEPGSARLESAAKGRRCPGS